MNVALWTLQVVLGVFFALHGTALLVTPQQLAEQMGALPYATAFLQFIGLAELLGGLGLILPRWLDIVPVLTPLAAAGLAVIMAGAVVTHLQAGEVAQVAVLSAVTALLWLVAVARWDGGTL